jgi:MOSC domain-containing protein YiiM
MSGDEGERGREGRIAGLQRSPGGVPKLPVASAAVSAAGMAGDRQRNLKFHGGPARALCLYSMELIDALVAEGHGVVPGALGENVTIAGLDWSLMRPGARVALGEVLAEVTSFTAPCRNIAYPFRDGDFMRVSEKVNRGWSRVYARVATAGLVTVGDVARVLPAP